MQIELLNNSQLQEFAQNTWMMAETFKIRINQNTDPEIDEINIGLTKRPKNILTLYETLERVKLILANGDVIIDTSVGLVRNAKILEDLVNIEMDEELMQGAVVECYYKFHIVNEGEEDRLSNYFRDVPDDIIANNIVIYTYISKNVNFSSELYVKEDNLLQLSEDVRNAIIENDLQVYKLETSLLPKQKVTIDMYSSKMISLEDGDEAFIHTGTSEIVSFYNSAGRRNSKGWNNSVVSGNYNYIARRVKEYDNTNPMVIITPPTGENLRPTIIWNIEEHIRAPKR